MENSRSWPCRRSPLPAAVLYGTPPRRRYKADSLSPAHRPFHENVTVYSDNADRWDSETVLSRTSSLDATSYNDARMFSLQVKQQKQSIDELTRQLELQESETAMYIRTVDKLKTELGDGHRRMQADRQEQQRYEKLIKWYEEQQKLQQKEASQTENSHRSVLRVAERRHRIAIEALLAKLAKAEEQSGALAERIAYLSEQLEMARSETNDAHKVSAVHMDQLHDAHLAVAQADEIAADLAIRLKGRCVYIDELEQRLCHLAPITAALPDHPLAESDCAKMEPLNIHRVNGHSLFVELSKATNSQPQLAPRNQSRTRKPALQTVGTFYNVSNGTNTQRANNSVSETRAANLLLQNQNQSQNQNQLQPEGIFYWLAVYMHMFWSLYLQLLLCPFLRLLGIVVRVALGIVVPEALLLAWLDAGSKIPHCT